MPDQVNPEANQQPGGSGSESPAPSPANNPGQSPDPQVVDWEGRYKGAMRVLNQKAQELTSLQEQLTGANNTVQSLQTQLQNGQAQWDATRQGLEQQVATITGERDQAQQTATELQAYQVKMQALAEFPELFPLADSIPNMDNPETMKEYLTGLQKNVDRVAEQKAQRLTAGLTPGATNPAQQTGYKYTTQEEWQNAMNQAAGGEEFQKISDAYLQWVQQGGGQ